MPVRPSSPMADALRLTREGRLTEAVSVIQGHLAEPASPAAGPAGPPAPPPGPVPQPLGSGGGRARSDVLIDGLVEALDRSRPAARTLAGLLAEGRQEGRRSATLPRSARALRPRGPGRLSSRTHSGPAGSRRYDLYVPAGATGAPAPLLLMLHGGR